MRMHAACVHGHHMHVISAPYDATDVIVLSPRCTGWMMCHVLFTWESAAIYYMVHPIDAPQQLRAQYACSIAHCAHICPQETRYLPKHPWLPSRHSKHGSIRHN